MNTLFNDRRGFWFGLALLALVGLFLGIRAGGAVRTVMGGRGWAATHPVGSTSTGVRGQGSAAKDSLLSAVGSPERDPFRDAPAPRAEGGFIQKAAPSEARVPPDLRALLYDNVNPSVQLSSGATTSGWLHKGDSFLGWTVVEITATSIRISRGGESIVLTSS
jgi:hypothetical protein